jgi:maltose alpha-D-glucosyltransferase / alpha-amylase
MTPGSAAAPGPPAAAARDWYRDAVIYQLHVKSFFDADNDGVGDFAGLLQKLDYICALGADTLWLLPFYPSPRLDDGYDVADYLGVHPDYGTLEDVRRFLDAAHERGLRVLGDLVLNHTSDQHAWFQRARRAPRGSPEHEFYVWADNDQRYPGTRIIFPDVEKSNWSWDPVAGRYYFHRFYAHQPDLNYDNPQVMEAVLAAMRHWLDLGLDGFRLDAVAYLVERDGTSNENLPETHAILKRLRAEIDAHYPDRVLLAEANQWPEDMKDYFGDDDECHMAFHFPLMPRMYMALAQEDRFPITDILRQTPHIPPRSQWAIFLRNHDELTLEMVTDAERDYLWNTYAADPRARINLGIRRRLAPLLERDRRRIELMTALLLTLPGTPVLYYGDELGMGDNIHLGDRDGVRTPMQWSVDRNGGFSRADAQRLVLPTLMDPLYGFQTINVESQERDPHSLLHWTRRLLALRHRYGALFGRGAIRFLPPRNRRVLVYLREWEERSVLCVVNLARTLQAVELDLAGFEGRVPVDIVGGARLPPAGRAPYLLTLPPYGVYLFELALDESDAGALGAEHAPELPTLVLREPLDTALARTHRERLEAELLPAWRQRQGRPAPASIERVLAAAPDEQDAVLLETLAPDGRRERVPLAIAWEGEPEVSAAASHALARVRRGARVGWLADASYARRLFDAWRDAWQRDEGSNQGALRFAREPGALLPEPRGVGVEPIGSGTPFEPALLDRVLLVTVARGGAVDLAGPLELIEALRERGYGRVLPLVARAWLTDATRETPIAFAQSWRPTRGHAGQWTLDSLRRGLHEFRAASTARQRELLRAFLPLPRQIGQHLGEMHRHLADAFGSAPEPWRPQQAVEHALALLAQVGERLRGTSAAATPHRLAAHARRIRALGAALEGSEGCSAIRVHGGLSLHHVAVTADDLFFVDLRDPDPELVAPGTVRHACRLSDVADVLAGFDHALAVLSHESGDDAEVRSFVAAFRGVARRGLLHRYRRAWQDRRDVEPAPGERRLLRLLQARRALLELDAARHPAAIAPAWQALQLALAA